MQNANFRNSHHETWHVPDNQRSEVTNHLMTRSLQAGDGGHHCQVGGWQLFKALR